MDQSLAIMLQHLCYGKINFILLVPGSFSILDDYNVNITSLNQSVVKFAEEVKNWRERLKTLDIDKNPLVARFVNDQMMKLGIY